MAWWVGVGWMGVLVTCTGAFEDVGEDILSSHFGSLLVSELT